MERVEHQQGVAELIGSIGAELGVVEHLDKRRDVGNHYDAKITYTMGDTVLSAGTDEVESHYVGLTTSVAGLSLTLRSEQDGKKKADGVTPYATAENEISVSYTMGALTVAYAKDTGDTGKFGDEAETLTTLTYDLGGVTLVAKGNDREESEVSAAFSF